MLLLLLTACAGPSGWTPAERATILTLSPLPPPVPRPTNAVADLPAAAALGEALFSDPGLSADGKTPCSECHDPKRHFTEDERVASAIGMGTRNTPTIETVAWSTWYFWDGRADSGWAQATGPMLNPIEMGMTAPRVQARLREAHAAGFESVFGGVAEDPQAALVQAGKALEAYERTQTPGVARFDRYVAALRAGTDSDLLTPQEKDGLRLFVGEAGCINCHHGPLFTDQSFHNIGLPNVPAGGIDPGRAGGVGKVLADPLNCRSRLADRVPGGPVAPGGDTAPPVATAPAADTGPDTAGRSAAAGATPADTATNAPVDPDADPCPELRYVDPAFPDWAAAFKTPSLRNVAVTSPYMHDGQMDSIGAILQFYNALPGQALVGHRELTLQPLAMSGAKLDAIEAFLGTLTADTPVDPAPDPDRR
jgi:cytochrome c peroxidase